MVHILTLKVFLVFFFESKVFWCFKKFFRLIFQPTTERMSEQYLRIDYNANSPSFGQRKRPSLVLNTISKKKWILTSGENIPFQFHGYTFAKFVFSLAIMCLIIYLNHDNGKSIQYMAKDILLKQILYHDTFVNHLWQNIDVAINMIWNCIKQHNLGKYNEHVCCIVQ